MALQSEMSESDQATVFNPSLFQSDRITAFKKEYNDFKPFPVLRIESFVKKDFIPKLESSLDENITFSKMDNDLFNFYQSYGLDELPANTPVQDLVQSLYSHQFREFLFKITGKKVSDKPDLFASCYKDTSYLLCHDDQVEDRSIAFILYLVPEDWNASDGGALNIYNSYTVDNPTQNANSSNTNDANTVAVNIFPHHNPCKQLIPKRNSVVIFEVSDQSFHAVDEILSADKSRIAIGGWWRNGSNSVTKIPIPDPEIVWKNALKPAVKYGDTLLHKWLNPTYLKDESIKQLQARFVEESHVTLMEFINEELYYKLLKQMFSVAKKNDASNEKNEICWRLKGPIHRRLYYELALNDEEKDSEDNVSLIKEFEALMTSLEWKAFIEKITCVDLLKHNVEMRRFEHRHYTIAHDLDRFKDSPGLDVLLQLVENEENGWDPMCGGGTYYTMGKGESETEEEEEGQNDEADREESEEDESMEGKEDEMDDDSGEEDENIIMRVHPFPNTLSIVYRSESGVMSFVKYLNHYAPCGLVDCKQVWSIKDEEMETINDKKRKTEDVVGIEPPQKKMKV
eukprot:96688_1